MRNLGGLTPSQFLKLVEATLSDKQAGLSAPVTDLLADVDPKRLNAFLDQVKPHKESWIDQAQSALPMLAPKAPLLPLIALTIGFGARRALINRNRKALVLITQSFSISRPVLELDKKELALIRAMAALTAQKLVTPQQWATFLAHVAYANGRLEPDPAFATNKHVPEAEAFARQLIKAVNPDYKAYLPSVAQKVAGYSGLPNATGTAIQSALTPGARWYTAEDLATDTDFTTRKTPTSVLLGRFAETGQPLYFNGNESLITIAAPGSGKSQAHVIPNLLTYPGSVMVLDVKGELWQSTAGYRAKTFGPVYRFSPLDPNARSHCFNPFDFVSADPRRAPDDSEVFSYQVIVPSNSQRDPYWENRGRDFLWALATLLAITASPNMRTMDRVTQLVGLPFVSSLIDDDGNPIVAPEVAKILQLLEQIGAKADIPDFITAANSLRAGGQSNRLEAIIDTARQKLAPFARSKPLRAAMSRSDWNPMSLRRRPGTSIYIVVPDDYLTAYAPVIRLMFYQHMRLLKNHLAKPGEPPITFLLDEMPQLGNFEAILKLQDVGRGAGLRLWMFAQTYGQLLAAYGDNRGSGLVTAAAVRAYLQPDIRTAEHLSKAFGTTDNVFTGERDQLVKPYELTGPEYENTVLINARSRHPMRLDRILAFKDMSDKMNVPPPVVPKLPTT